MRLIITKVVRKIKKDPCPINCYAGLYMPISLKDTCDCKLFCKYPPKGNAKIGYFDKLPINNEPLPNITFYSNKLNQKAYKL